VAFSFYFKLRNIFGSTRHGPRALFRKHAKFFNNGRELNLMQPSECRMAGEVMQFLRVLRLKEALQATSRDKVFVDYKRFSFVCTVLNNDAFWDCLFAIIQALYPIFRILRLADMKVGGMDKLYYYVMQTDRLLKPGLENVMKLWNEPKMPTMELHFMKLTKADREFLKGKFLVLLITFRYLLSLTVGIL
jgi:hypothetical protein